MITGTTGLAGIIGDPVSHSLSPRMHNAAYAAMGIDMVYVPMRVDGADLEAAVAGIRALGFVGVNVTIPHKLAVAPLLDGLHDSAVAAGAVNTIVRDGEALIGHNTDGEGFIAALEESFTPDYPSSPALIVGAGGAARSVGVALAEKGIPSLLIVNRSRGRAEEFQELLRERYPHLEVEIHVSSSLDPDSLRERRIIVNATPLGMSPDLKPLRLPVDRLSKDQVVCDLVYAGSGRTPLESQAIEKGAATMGGLGMLLHQGAAAIQLWTKRKPPLEVMRQAIESRRGDIPQAP